MAGDYYREKHQASGTVKPSPFPSLTAPGWDEHRQNSSFHPVPSPQKLARLLLCFISHLPGQVTKVSVSLLATCACPFDHLCPCQRRQSASPGRESVKVCWAARRGTRTGDREAFCMTAPSSAWAWPRCLTLPWVSRADCSIEHSSCLCRVPEFHQLCYMGCSEVSSSERQDEEAGKVKSQY